MKLIVSLLSGNEAKSVKELTTLDDLEKILKAAEMLCNHIELTPTVILEKWVTDNEWHLIIADEIFGYI